MKTGFVNIAEHKLKFSRKDQIIVVNRRGILVDFWVPHEIESCICQNLLAFGFPETSQNLILFRQLLFSFPNTQEICQNCPVLWRDDLVLLSFKNSKCLG